MNNGGNDGDDGGNDGDNGGNVGVNGGNAISISFDVLFVSYLLSRCV